MTSQPTTLTLSEAFTHSYLDNVELPSRLYVGSLIYDCHTTLHAKPDEAVTLTIEIACDTATLPPIIQGDMESYVLYVYATEGGEMLMTTLLCPYRLIAETIGGRIACIIESYLLT